ncbi:MAG: response regulator [Pseudomonadota bacterium]
MTISILAVDDSRTMRDMLKLALDDAGMQAHLAEDGEHGLEVLNDVEPNAIITDINMPKLDGFGFINAVRKIDRLKSVPILVLTTESAEELKTKARLAGATGWIVKPFDPDKLVRALRMVCG